MLERCSPSTVALGAPRDTREEAFRDEADPIGPGQASLGATVGVMERWQREFEHNHKALGAADIGEELVEVGAEGVGFPSGLSHIIAADFENNQGVLVCNRLCLVKR